MEVLINKKQIEYNGSDLFIDIYKQFYCYDLMDRPCYIYNIIFYRRVLKGLSLIDRIFNIPKYTIVYGYKSAWTEYYEINGCLTNIVNKALKSFSYSASDNDTIKSTEKSIITKWENSNGL